MPKFFILKGLNIRVNLYSILVYYALPVIGISEMDSPLMINNRWIRIFTCTRFDRNRITPSQAIIVRNCDR